MSPKFPVLHREINVNIIAHKKTGINNWRKPRGEAGKAVKKGIFVHLFLLKVSFAVYFNNTSLKFALILMLASEFLFLLKPFSF